MNLLKGSDYFLATLFGVPAGIYISSYVAFKEWGIVIKVLNWVFRDDNHCVVSMMHNKEDIEYYYKE